MTPTFYARVLVGGTTGTIVVRPEGTTAGTVRLTVNALAGPTYLVGQRVLVLTTPAVGGLPCVLGVVQPWSGPWAAGGAETYDT